MPGSARGGHDRRMNARMSILILVIAAFGALTWRALAEHGYFGLIAYHLQTWGSGQLLADLTIMCLLGCGWMIGDARQRGATAWPFVLLTLAAGSFGPLLYLLNREWKGANTGK